MENASKALLIAGAILITLLIISVSVIIYNSVVGSSKEEQKQLTSQEIQMFNKQFTKYAGKNISAINTQNLINAVKSNNAKYKEGELKHIYINYSSEMSDFSEEMVTYSKNGSEKLSSGYRINRAADDNIRINPSSLYNIDVATNDETGLVETIFIVETLSSGNGGVL